MPTSSHRKGWTPARSKTPMRRFRTRAEQILQARERMMHDMTSDIGVNPVYLNACYGTRTERAASEKLWLIDADAWVKDN